MPDPIKALGPVPSLLARGSAEQAAKSLDGIIQTARAGRWQPAAERLYDFMKGQKREGDRKR